MTFSKLPNVIGPAPSELSNEDLLTRLASERDRVRRTFTWWRTNQAVTKKAKASPKAPKAPRQRKLATDMKKAGVTLGDLRAVISKLQKEKGIQS